MTRVPAYWGSVFVQAKRGRCPRGNAAHCYHERKQLCVHYHGTTKQVCEPYVGPVTVLCSAPKKGDK